MKKIIVLIAIFCSFSWCNCTLKGISTYSDDGSTHFKFKCKTPFEYMDNYKTDSTIYHVVTLYKVTSTQQCNYRKNGDKHCINIETNDKISCGNGSCKVDFVLDKFGIYTYEKTTSLTSARAETETTKIWNNLKKYIPFKNNKIDFPITNR